MPETSTENQMPGPDSWDDFESVIPEEYRPNYRRFLGLIRSQRPDDAMYQGIMALGYIMMIARQFPATMVEELKTAKAQMPAFQTAIQEESAKHIKLLAERTAKLENLHNLVLTEAFMKRVVMEAMEMIQDLLSKYCNPLMQQKAESFALRIDKAAESIEKVRAKSASATESLDGMMKTFNRAIAEAKQLSQECRDQTLKETVMLLQTEEGRRTRRWILVAAISQCLIFGIEWAVSHYA